MELTDKDERRLKKLKQSLAKLQSGENVQNRTLQTWLTDNEFELISEFWEEQKEIREELKYKPAQIKEYEKRFKKAEFAYNKANNHSLQGNRNAAKNGFRDAEIKFESLLMYLEEIIDADPGLAEWFDREICFEPGKEPSIDPVGMPRTITSYSTKRQSGNDKSLTKNDIKLRVVETAIFNINSIANSSAITTEDEAKLKHLLSKIKKS